MSYIKNNLEAESTAQIISFPFDEYLVLSMSSFFSQISRASWKLWVIVEIFDMFDFWLSGPTDSAQGWLGYAVRVFLGIFCGVLWVKVKNIKERVARLGHKLGEHALETYLEKEPLIQSADAEYYSLFWFKSPNLLVSLVQIAVWGLIVSNLNYLMMYNFAWFTGIFLSIVTMMLFFMLFSMAATISAFIQVGPNTNLEHVKEVLKRKPHKEAQEQHLESKEKGQVLQIQSSMKDNVIDLE